MTFFPLDPGTAIPRNTKKKRSGVYSVAKPRYDTTMTHDELITEARIHTKDIPRLSGEPWATMEMLPNVTTVDAVAVYFESDQRPGKIIVVLEQESGKFILSCLNHPCQKAK